MLVKLGLQTEEGNWWSQNVGEIDYSTTISPPRYALKQHGTKIWNKIIFIIESKTKLHSECLKKTGLHMNQIGLKSLFNYNTIVFELCECYQDVMCCNHEVVSLKQL